MRSSEVNSHWHVNARLDASMKVNKDAGEKDSDKVTLQRAWAEGDYDNFNVKLGKLELLSAEAYTIWQDATASLRALLRA